MLQITVKTLDSQNHSFTCEEDITVRGFKEHIADTVSVSADSQRLIFCGRVLQDDKKLTDYGDINGKVIHLVQRAPPQAESRNSNGDSQRQNADWNSDGARGIQYRGHLHRNAMYLSAVSVPTEFVENHGLPAPQLSNTLSSSRLQSAKRMMNRANQIMDRLDDPSLPLHPSPTENNAPETHNPPTTSEEDAEHDRTFTNRIIQAASEMFPTAAVINIRLSSANEDEDNASTSEQSSAQTHESELQSSEGGRSGAESSEPERPEPESSESERPEVSINESNDSQSRRSTANVPRPPQMADLLERLVTTQDRLRPYIDRYRNLMANDPTLTPGNGPDGVSENQKIVDGVSESLHYLSHACHALSDIIVDMGQQPPRNLRCRPIIIQQSAILQAGIPIQVESHINLAGRNANNASRTTDEGNEATRPSSPSPSTPDQASRSSGIPNNQNSRSIPQRSINGQPNAQSFLGTLLDMSNLMHTSDGQSPQVTLDSSSPNVGESSEAEQGSTFNNSNGRVGNMYSMVTPPLALIRDAIQSALSERTGVQMEPSNNGTTNTANIPFVTIVGQQMDIGTPNSGQSTQARSNIGTHPTTSTQTRSTARPHVLHPHTHPLNMGMGMGHNLEFDPFLPCNSHHVRRNPPASSTATSQSSSQTVTSENQNRAQASGTTQSASTSARTQGQPISFSFGGDANLARDLFDTEGQAIANGIGLAMTLGELFQGSMGDNVHISFVGGGPNSNDVHMAPTNDVPLAELLRSMNVSFDEFTGRNFLIDLWLFLLRNVTFGGLMQLNLGQPTPLVGLRRPLREFLEHSFPDASPATLQDQVVEQLISINRSYLQNLIHEEEMPQRDGRRIDIPATIEALFRKFCKEFLRHLFNNDLDDRTFAQEAITLAKKLEDQSSAVLQHVLRGGQTALEAMAQRFINQLTEGVPVIIQQTIMSVFIARIRAYATRTTQISQQEINSLLIYKDELSAPPAPSAPPADVAMDVTPSTSAIIEEDEAQASALPLNHQSPSRSGILRAEDILTWSEPMETERVREKKLDDIPDLADGQEIPETFPGAERLPPEWIPIIARDSVRQRRQAQIDALNGGPIPFSDAYLSTLPSKRRKLIEQQKPQILVSPTPPNTTAIAASVERLVREGMTHARVQEVEGAAGAVAAAPGVRNAFGHAIRDCLHPGRLRTPDFPNAKRFPNASKMFGDQDQEASASKTSK